jgi:hypothetical protein
MRKACSPIAENWGIVLRMGGKKGESRETGAKVDAERITEYRVRITEGGLRRTESCEDRAKVQIGRRPVQKWKGKIRRQRHRYKR